MVIKVANALRWERALNIGKQGLSWFARWGTWVLPRGLGLASGLLVSLVLGVADVVFLVFELHWVRDLWHHLSTSRGVIA